MPWIQGINAATGTPGVQAAPQAPHQKAAMAQPTTALPGLTHMANHQAAGPPGILAHHHPHAAAATMTQAPVPYSLPPTVTAANYMYPNAAAVSGGNAAAASLGLMHPHAQQFYNVGAINAAASAGQTPQASGVQNAANLPKLLVQGGTGATKVSDFKIKSF